VTSAVGGESFVVVEPGELVELLAAAEPGWVARTSPRTTRKLPAAVRVTIRFARETRVFPAAILELSCFMSSEWRREMKER
jgi:hypothetical protein